MAQLIDIAVSERIVLRRSFLSASSLALGASATGFASSAFLQAVKGILDYGAQPGGKTLNTKSVQGAIAFLTGNRSPVGSKLFTLASGAQTANITLVGNALNQGEQPVGIANGATKEAIKVQ